MSSNYYNYDSSYGFSNPSGYESRNSQLEAQGVDTDIDLIYGKGFQPSSTTPGGNCDTTGLERIARFNVYVNTSIESEDGINILFQENIRSIQKSYRLVDGGSGMMRKTWSVTLTIDPKITILRYKSGHTLYEDIRLMPKSDSPYTYEITLESLSA